MKYEELQKISKRRPRHDNAAGNGTDQSTDPGPKRDPNNFLAPIFGNEIFIGIAKVAAIALVVSLAVIAVKAAINNLKKA